MEAPEREGSISEGREIMAPMKLYGATMSWNVTRCVVALEEAGADYEIVPINFATAEHKSPEHLARNVRILSPAPLSPLFFRPGKYNGGAPFAC